MNTSYVLDDLAFVERSFHSLAPLYEKRFCPKVDLQRGMAKSVLILRTSRLPESDNLMTTAAR